MLDIGDVGGPAFLAGLSVTLALRSFILDCSCRSREVVLFAVLGGKELNCHHGCSCHLLPLGASGSVHCSNYRSGAVHGRIITK